MKKRRKYREIQTPMYRVGIPDDDTGTMAQLFDMLSGMLGTTRGCITGGAVIAQYGDQLEAAASLLGIQEQWHTLKAQIVEDIGKRAS